MRQSIHLVGHFLVLLKFMYHDARFRESKVHTGFFWEGGGGAAQKEPVNYNVLNKNQHLVFCPVFFC